MLHDFELIQISSKKTLRKEDFLSSHTNYSIEFHGICRLYLL